VQRAFGETGSRFRLRLALAIIAEQRERESG
jgi:hypothetical protein